MATQNRIGKGNTSISTNENNITSVIFHSTAVVKFSNDRIVLDSGGWLTVTTKSRMNQTSNQFNLGFGVYQVKGNWFISFEGNTIEFQDKMVLDRN